MEPGLAARDLHCFVTWEGVEDFNSKRCEILVWLNFSIFLKIMRAVIMTTFK